MRQWALQDAKARFNEVVRLACEHEPQEITLRGEPAVVVLSRVEFDRLTQPRESLVEFMRRSPLYGADDIAFARDPSLTREVVTRNLADFSLPSLRVVNPWDDEQPGAE